MSEKPVISPEIRPPRACAFSANSTVRCSASAKSIGPAPYFELSLTR
jgi:hypothetical protein